MNFESVKTRFMGSYVFLILLFLIQLPIVYMLVGGMSKKYAQIDAAADLRKRAVEINYVLNRHIMNGEEELESVFQAKRVEFGEQIDALKNGTKDIAAIKDANSLQKLEVLKNKWTAMRAAMDEAMTSGDSLSVVMTEIEQSTYPMVDKMNLLVKGFVATHDQSYARSIDLAGLQRMRTVNLSYLMERYARSNYELDLVADNIKKTVADFDSTLNGLRFGSAELGLRPVGSKDMIVRFKDAEDLWSKRKSLVSAGMKDKDVFLSKVKDLSNIHTPGIVASADELTRQIADNARSSAIRGILIMAAAVILSTAMAIFFMYLTNFHIIRPVIRIKETVEGFAKGDLSQRANVKINILGKEFNDEIKNLGDSVDEMAVQMSDVIGRISDSSNHLASASEQLSSSSTLIAEGADKQSSQTSQVATAMEEMNATVIEVAKNSQQASDSARTARDMATRGGDVVTQAIAAMQEVAASTAITAKTIKELGKSSEEIGTIVSVINDIADQTNLLALNAAIEAARAGEQGRGFAVVADEVRKLAERTTKATKEISSMIKTIQTETGKAVDAMDAGTDRVENGVKLANEAGDALKQIFTGVEDVTDKISHIATSAEEQSSTTDEITRNMDSIAEVAKSNVAAIGEVANATGEMSRLATELKELVSKFRILKSYEAVDIKAAAGIRKAKGQNPAVTKRLKAVS